MVSRRNFVKGAGFLPLLTASDLSFAGNNDNGNKPKWKGPAIKSITILKGTGNFNRFIAQNAYDTAPKGIKGVNSFVKVTLDDGTEGLGGVGYVRPNEEVYTRLKSLLGKDPLGFYTWKGDQITGVAKDMEPFFTTPNTAG